MTAEASAPSIDVTALGPWLDEAGLPGAGDELTITPLTGGASNEVYRLERGGAAVVLRRPPAHAVEERSATMMREARVLGALADTAVPHARLLGSCEDASVIGSAFYVMELVDGWSPMSAGSRGPVPFDTDHEARAGLGREIVRGIAELASVDWRAAGLEGFGRPDGFHDRQVPRWTSFLDKVAFRDIPGLDAAGRWLTTHRPRTWEPGIIHGDYSFANVMFGHGTPPRLAAIVDWEMATIGDPLLDLGWLLMRWPSPDGPRPTGSFDMDGMPTPAEVLDLYSTVSGRPVDEIDYYLTLACFKNAIVLEAGFAQYMKGDADNPKMALFGDMVLEMAELAARVSAGSSLPSAG
ncbi:phosphotransferase family protein [Aeromicrobium ginsengisoli]|uniref:Phosphotransferase family protein n=1 Tax=Aeromicrobium ginsengisoli TaxID=363867 RepID=A0A5M4FAK7_9ACTN|nr:phosphotransferase family protein [Aeromicrobium ginsengisoli]KAA1394279.1 phosphotransferase family protein [Aeromicrobium ginsengisoli]